MYVQHLRELEEDATLCIIGVTDVSEPPLSYRKLSPGPLKVNQVLLTSKLPLQPLTYSVKNHLGHTQWPPTLQCSETLFSLISKTTTKSLRDGQPLKYSYVRHSRVENFKILSHYSQSII